MKKDIEVGRKVYVACGINMFGTVVEIYPSSRLAGITFDDNLVIVPFACIDNIHGNDNVRNETMVCEFYKT